MGVLFAGYGTLYFFVSERSHPHVFFSSDVRRAQSVGGYQPLIEDTPLAPKEPFSYLKFHVLLALVRIQLHGLEF